MKSSRRVLDDRVLEVGPDTIAIGGDELHVLISGGTQSGFGASRHFGADSVLEIGVEPFVGIELGAVAGQEEGLDVGPVFGQPPNTFDLELQETEKNGYRSATFWIPDTFDSGFGKGLNDNLIEHHYKPTDEKEALLEEVENCKTCN